MNIQKIFADAKRALLADGKQFPATLFFQVEECEEPYVAVFASFECQDTTQKCQMFFATGRSLGAMFLDRKLQEVCFVTEVWMSQVEPGSPPRVRPRDDPQRREALMALAMKILPDQSVQHTLVVAEIIRDAGGNVIDFLTYDDDKIEDPQSQFLIYFLAGFESMKIPNEEFEKIIEKTMQGHND